MKHKTYGVPATSKAEHAALWATLVARLQELPTDEWLDANAPDVWEEGQEAVEPPIRKRRRAT